MISRRMPVVQIASLALFLMAGTHANAAEPTVRKDLHGDPLPEAITARLGTIRWRPQEGIYYMAFVPGSRLLATTGGGPLSFWDIEAGGVRTARATPLGEGCYRFAFASDGKRLLSAAEVSLFFCDTATGKVLLQTDTDTDNPPEHLAVRSDGLVAAWVSRSGDVYKWDLQKNKKRRLFKGDGDGVILNQGLSFAAESKHLVVQRGAEYRRFNVESGELLRKGEVNQTEAMAALAPETGTLATYTRPDQLCLYDTLTGVKRTLTPPEKADILVLSFSMDGGTLLAANPATGDVQFWDVAQGKLLRRVHVDGITFDLAPLLLSHDGTTLASSENHRVLRFWDARTGKAKAFLPGHVLPPVGLAFSADGKEVLSHNKEVVWDGKVVSRDGDQWMRWDAATGKHLQTLILESRGTPAARRLLQKLAGGVPEARLTQAAKEALKRLVE